MLPLVLPLLTSLAPVLARAVTGSDRGGEIAAAAASVVERAAGIAPDTPQKVERVQAMIQADPKLFMEMRTQLQTLEQAELEALLGDRQDARARDVALRRLGAEGAARANVMLAMAFGGVVAIGVVLVLLNAYGAANEFTGAIFGFLTGIGGMFARNIGSAFDFEFGSSRGSQQKSRQIETLSARLQSAHGLGGPAAVSGLASGAAEVVRSAPGAIEAVREAFGAGEADDLNRKSLGAFRRRMAGAPAGG